MHQKIEITLKKNKKIVFLLLFLGLFSCDKNLEFSKYITLQNASWKADEKISFEFDVTDTISPKNLFINIRNNKEYPYSNLYVITELNFPNGTKIVDTLQYEMADQTGKFLGKGFANIKENKLYYKENKVFPQSGTYNFNIRQAMRKNGEVHPIPFLKGVQDVGFSIEKIE